MRKVILTEKLKVSELATGQAAQQGNLREDAVEQRTLVVQQSGNFKKTGSMERKGIGSTL